MSFTSHQKNWEQKTGGGRDWKKQLSLFSFSNMSTRLKSLNSFQDKNKAKLHPSLPDLGAAAAAAHILVRARIALTDWLAAIFWIFLLVILWNSVIVFSFCIMFTFVPLAFWIWMESRYFLLKFCCERACPTTTTTASLLGRTENLTEPWTPRLSSVSPF